MNLDVARSWRTLAPQEVNDVALEPSEVFGYDRSRHCGLGWRTNFGTRTPASLATTSGRVQQDLPRIESGL